MTEVGFVKPLTWIKFDIKSSTMKLLYTIAALFITTALSAQVYAYQALIPGSVSTLMYETTETSTAYYHTGSSNTNDPFLADILVYKTDKLGTPVWSYTYGDSAVQEGGWAIREANNGTLVVYAQKDFNEWNSEVVMLGLDTNGNLLWTHSYGGSASEIVQQFTETPDGGFLIYGTTSSVGDGSSNLFTMKVDMNGNVLWDHVYGDQYAAFGFDVTTTPDSGFMAVGYYTDLGGNHTHLLKLNSIGDTVWSKQFVNSADIELGSIQTISTGGYLITGRCDTSKGMVMRIDDNGNHLWTRTYDNGTSVYINEGYEHSGGFVFAGTHFNQSASSNMFLLQTDTSGNVLWTRSYGSNDADQVMSLLPTTDNGLMISGASWGFMPGVHGFMIKTDDLGASGCNEYTVTFNAGSTSYTTSPLPIPVMTGLSDTVIVIPRRVNPGYQNLCGTSVEENASLNVEVYPNPVSGDVNPQLNSTEVLRVMIYSVDGSLLSDEIIQPSGTITIPETPGMYLIRMYKDGNLYTTQRIIRSE